MDSVLSILSTSVITSTIIGVLFYFFRKKVAAYILYETKYQFDKKLFDYQNEKLKREKAALIAELLSEWISHPDNYNRLNKLTFEAFIWLPEKIADKLSACLAKQVNAPNIREIIVEIRQHILSEERQLDPHKIVVFSKKEG